MPRNEQSEKTEKSSYHYQYLSVNQITNETTLGMITIVQNLEMEQISYSGDEGNQVLISHFGKEQYHCSGSCYCSSSNEERRSLSSASQVLTHGIIYLVAAMSTVVAKNKAEEYFLHECLDRYSEQCFTNSIVSEIDNCEPINAENEGNMEDNSEDINIHRYFCNGHCLPSKRLRSEEAIRKSFEFGCETLKFSGKVEFDLSALKKTPRSTSVVAKEIFQKDYLTPFCRSGSIATFRYRRKSENYEYPRKTTVSLCTGTRRKGRIAGCNPTIKCFRGFWGS